MNPRATLIILASIALLALLGLAAGLHDVQFEPAQSIGRAEAQAVQISIGQLLEQISDVPFWKQIAFWLALFLLVLMVASIFSPDLRKRILWAFIRLAILFLTVSWIVQNREQLGLNGLIAPAAIQQTDSASTMTDMPPPVFVAPEISSTTVFMLSFAFVALTFFLLWRFGRGLTARVHADNPASLDAIADAARASLDDLTSGRDWEDAILRAYTRMTKAVAYKRGLHRQQAMTAAEFAVRLQNAGLPNEAVTRLTRLFESARYGARRADPREQQEAADCLNSILRACGEPA